MISGIIHKGSGLGDQLFRYLTVRCLAEKQGVEWGFVSPEFFKGSFLGLELHKAPYEFIVEEPAGKSVPNAPVWEEGTTYYNPEINFIKEGIIDGNLQDPRYWDIKKFRNWIKLEPLELPDDLCIINFRGGEFSYVPELFLPKSYWKETISLMLEKNPEMEFEVHTDDPALASKFFPNFEIIRNIERNWNSVRSAKNIILSNSAFGILPALLSGGHVIAPRYWARRNKGYWSLPSNYYPSFQYI